MGNREREVDDLMDEAVVVQLERRDPQIGLGFPTACSDGSDTAERIGEMIRERRVTRSKQKFKKVER